MPTPSELVWIYTDPMTGNKFRYKSAQDLVDRAMEDCRKNGWRWPPRQDGEVVHSVDVQIDMTLRQAKEGHGDQA